MWHVCAYCIEGARSRGERILVGNYCDEGFCDWCGEVDELQEVDYADE